MHERAVGDDAVAAAPTQALTAGSPRPPGPPAAPARTAGAVDQASGLRRLFGALGPQVLPILVGPGGASAPAAAIIGLAQACARAGERTLVLDCARAHIAARLGLRARFDLLHALQGECRFDRVRLDAGAGLCVVPAARAASAACAAGAGPRVLVAPLLTAEAPADLVVLVVERAHAPLLRALRGGEVLVLMPRAPFALRETMRALARARDEADIAAFRLLFPGWDADAAARLSEELATACPDRHGVALRCGGAVRTARDWQRVARAMSGWELARLATPHLARTF